MQSNIHSKVATRQKLSQCSMRIGALFLVVLLSGCAASADPTTTPSANANVAACEEFLVTFNTIADANADRNEDKITVEEWYAIVDDAALDYSAVSLIAEGDLKTRIEDLVDLIDDQESGVRSLHGLSDDFDLYVSHLNRIAQVCTDVGVPMSFGTG